MFIAFKCTAGSKDGWGNIFRLKIIFQELKKKIKFNYLFIVNNNLELINYLKKNKIKYKTFDNFEKEKKFIKDLNIDISIIELLDCKYSIQKIYKLSSKKLVILDDIARKKYISDILFICQKKKMKSANIKIFNDFKFFPVDTNFNKFLKKKMIIKKKIKNIAVFLGGGFYSKEFYKIAKTFRKKNYNVNFIIGYEIKKKNLNKIKSTNQNFKFHIKPKNIPEIIYKSDLVISGGGYTKVEAAYLSKPVIPIPIHFHQIELCKRFKKQFNIDYLLKSEIEKLIIKKINNYSYGVRKKISKNFRKIFYINGVYRILKIILNEK